MWETHIAIERIDVQYKATTARRGAMMEMVVSHPPENADSGFQTLQEEDSQPYNE